MNPTVQVALVSILATLITTTGVVIVAIIENRRRATPTENDDLDVILDRMFYLMEEVERKKETISSLRKKVKVLNAEIQELQAIVATKENNGEQ